MSENNTIDPKEFCALTVRDLIVDNCFVLSPTQTLQEAIVAMCENHLCGAPVVSEQGDLLGFITDHDLLDICFDENLKHELVGNCMTEDVCTLNADDSLATAIQLFLVYRFKYLPVVSDGTLVGFVSRGCVLMHALRQPDAVVAPLPEMVAAMGNV